MSTHEPPAVTVMLLINGLGAGGAERSTAELLPHIAEAGIHPVTVCLRHRNEGVEQEVIDAGFDVRFVESTSFIGRVRALRGLLAEVRPAVLHTHHFESDLIGRFAAIGRDVAVMSSVVNTSYDEVRLDDPRVRRWKLRVVRALDGWTARHLTDHVHAITRAVKAAAMEALRIDEGKVTVVERGRDPVRLGLPSPGRRAAARQSLGLDESDEVVINVARQEFQKGQRFLLEAAASLRKDRPRLRVLIAGRTGNATSDLERTTSQLALGDTVTFLGHRDDVPELLAATDVFVFPSLYEGLGGALLEAMALHVPIVASDIPALREVLEDGRGGVLVEPSSALALRDAVAHLLDHPDQAAKVREAAGDIFTSRFTLEQSAAGMVKLYRELATTKAGPR